MEMEPTPLFPTNPESNTKLKNSFALIILLAGLFVGSLFVDIGELITGSGFSGSALREQTVLETAGKTWVAYTDPAINVTVVSDPACIECAPDEALLWLRRIMPTLRAESVAADSFDGQALIAKHSLVSLPAFVFDQGIEKTDFYAEAAPLFIEREGQYFFDMNKIGLPVGRYLEAPAVSEGDIELGLPGALATVTIFSDFACEYCREYHASYRELVTLYGDRVAFVFKHFPLPTHPEASNAALAASCAHEQGYFLPYADLLFERQAEWSKKSSSTTLLKSYAWRIKGMNGQDFARCIDENRYAATIEANRALAEHYNLQAAPMTFVGSDFVSGAAPKEEVEGLITALLEQKP